MNQRYLFTASLATLVFALTAGCNSSGSMFRDPGMLVKDPGRIVGRPKIESNVARIVTLWEASQGKDPSDKPARGFAGQILFFGPHGDTGARIFGTVVISEYDNYDAEALDEPEPLHSFTFEPEAWDLHRTEGTLGHSYSCFIPYMSKNRDQVTCGLKVDFIDKDGRHVSSEIVEVMLPSRSATNKAAAASRGFVREAQIGGKPLVQKNVSVDVESGKPLRLESFSIPLPNK